MIIYLINLFLLYFHIIYNSFCFTYYVGGLSKSRKSKTEIDILLRFVEYKNTVLHRIYLLYKYYIKMVEIYQVIVAVDHPF